MKRQRNKKKIETRLGSRRVWGEERWKRKIMKGFYNTSNSLKK